MGFTKDLHTRKGPDGKRVRTAAWGKGKRWLAVWHDESGRERSLAFALKDAADRYWQAMETARAQGDYHDPKAGRELLSEIGKRWLASRVVDPATAPRYESAWRLHVEPVFGKRQVGAIKPSHVQAWLAKLTDATGKSTVTTAYLVLSGVLDLAVADGLIRVSPAKSVAVARPQPAAPGKVVPWTAAQVGDVTDAHPAHLRLLPVLMAGCGLRIGEAVALSVEDFDFDDGIVRVQRQLKRLGTAHIYSLPKNDMTRDIPLPDSVAAAVRAHVKTHPPWPCTLPWEKLTGKQETHQLLFRWSDDSFVRYRSYSEQTWKPALASAGIIPEPGTDKRGRRRYETTHKEGPHQLRHYYASVMLDGGASIRDLAEFLGHHHAAFTLRVYSHLMPGSHERARNIIDGVMFKPRAVSS